MYERLKFENLGVVTRDQLREPSQINAKLFRAVALLNAIWNGGVVESYGDIDILPSTVNVFGGTVVHSLSSKKDTIAVAASESFEGLPSLIISGLVVDSRYQGIGISRHLLSQIEDYAKDRGHTVLRLSAFDNLVPYYRHLGFEQLEPADKRLMMREISS